MNKEKTVSLERYATELTNKLANTTVPEKHKGREETYKTFLRRELEVVRKTLERAKTG